MTDTHSTPAQDGNLPTLPPMQLAQLEDGHWSRECEVLVAGFGAAGAAAAIAAHEAGANVMLADRFEGGGASAKSGGIVYAGGGTKHQKKAGYEDTPANMFNYLRLETGDAVSETTLKRFCEDSVGLLEWLESMGAAFDSDAPPPKTSYPKDGVYLYYSGNEGISPYADHATPAPRGHRMRDKGLSGHALFAVLRARVESLGIPCMARSALRRLITVEGTVVGAELWQLPPGSDAEKQHRRLTGWAETIHNGLPGLADRLRRRALAIELRDAKPVQVRATRGVVLTTGGFIFNRQMVGEHAPKYLDNMRLGTTGCDGSGIRLGASVGGQPQRLHKVSAWRFINPPQPWARGMVVNWNGQRFCNEQAYGAKLGVAMIEHHNARAWLVLDATQRKAALRDALFGKLWLFQSIPAIFLMLFSKRANTLAQLAIRLGIPAERMLATQAAYNAAARGEAEDELGKRGEFLQALDGKRWYAIDIAPTNPLFPCPAITLGGLKIDETTGAVVDQHDKPIPGLYAAGRAAIGVASNNYVSGLSLADCLWSGRRAGRQFAADNAD